MPTKQAEVYECDRCGLCCTELIVEANHSDVLREPRIAEKCELLDGNGKTPILEARWSIAVGTTVPCPFFNNQRLCDIYPTRPGECVRFIAGSPKCQELRENAGLPRLKPTKAPVTRYTQLRVAIHKWQKAHA